MKTVALHEIAGWIGAEIVIPPGCKMDGNSFVSGIGPLHRAKAGEISFLTSATYEKSLPDTGATAVIVGAAHSTFHAPCVLLVHKNPYWAFAIAASRLVKAPKPDPAISPHAHVDPTARIGSGVVIYPGAYIGPGAEVGDGTEIRANVVIEHGCKIGKNCTIHAGSVIGADGFGFAPGPASSGVIAKVPQIGIVIIEDDVEIGACSTIDRAAFDATTIKKGAKLDSHVHVGHNCTVGESAMICGLSGMAGSSSLGKGAILAGHVGVPNQVDVGPGVVVAAFSMMTKSHLSPGQYAGIPAVPMAEWRKQQVLVRKLPEMAKRIRELEKLLEKKQ